MGECCGFVHEANALGDVGGVCCVRPVWAETGRCIWHAEEARKPADALRESLTPADVRLDGADLREVTLAGGEFLAGRSLVDSRFADCNFREVAFDGADLRGARFRVVDARDASFRGAKLENAEFDRTDLRGAALDDARLYNAVFDGVRINEETTFGTRVAYERELADSDARADRLELFETARWTYRALQRLAERNGMTPRARQFYLREKDLRRRFAWETGSPLRAVAEEGWRWTTGYGSSPWRVIATSAAVILGCAVLYPLTGGLVEGLPTDDVRRWEVLELSEAAPLVLLRAFSKSLYFSTVTFATLGYGDIQPVGPWARAIAGFEALLGQLLLALLVFVLTRTVTWSE